VFIPYVYLGGGTWAPVNGFVDRFERIAGRPPVYSFRSTVQLSLGSTILLTIYYYSTTANAGYLTPIDVGYVLSARSEALEYIYEYEVDSFLTMLYNAPLEVASHTLLSSLVSGIVNGINASTGLGVRYFPRGFEESIGVEPRFTGRFNDLLSRVLRGSVDYAFSFGSLEFTAVAMHVGSVIPYLTAVRSNSLIDGYYDTFSPITILDNSSNYEAVPSSMGSSGLLKRRLLRVVTKPIRVSVIVWVPPSNTVCLDKTYSEACIALDYKLQGEIEVWKIVPTTPVPPGEIPQDYQLVFKLCCRGEVGSERASGCDYSVDMRANEEKDRLVLTFRDEVVGDGSYFLVVMDAVKVFYIEDDSIDSKQVETYVLEGYRDVGLLPEYPSGTYFLLSRDGEYIKSRDPRLYLIAKTNPLTGLSEMVMVPGKPFFKKNTLKPEGFFLPGLLVNTVMERGAANHLVSRIRFDTGRLVYEFKPFEHHTSYIEALEELRKAIHMPI
jgi:hypothetical protein